MMIGLEYAALVFIDWISRKSIKNVSKEEQRQEQIAPTSMEAREENTLTLWQLSYLCRWPIQSPTTNSANSFQKSAPSNRLVLSWTARQTVQKVSALSK